MDYNDNEETTLNRVNKTNLADGGAPAAAAGHSGNGVARGGNSMLEDVLLLLLQVFLLSLELICALLNVLQQLLVEMRILQLSEGTWHGDTRACEQGQIIYQYPAGNRPINMNDINTTAASQPMKTTDTNSQSAGGKADVVNNADKIDNPGNTEHEETDNEPSKMADNETHVRLTFATNRPRQSSLTSSSDSSDSSKTTTWGKLKQSSPTKCKKESRKSQNINSPNTSPTKNKNEVAMTTWKDVSPPSSDLEHSNHSNNSCGSHDSVNRMFRFSKRMKGLNDSSSSSDLEPVNRSQQMCKYANEDHAVVANQIHENKCPCNSSANGGAPCKKSSCNCSKSKNCISHLPDNQNSFTNSSTSVGENENGSPKKEKGVTGSPDDLCDNEYYYEDDFTVQFDTNLRETSVTPIDSDASSKNILEFPHMVTGSYLCFHGESSNVSFNNSKASSNMSLNNIRGSNIINNMDDRAQYDSELSGNSGSHNSTMEMSSSEKDMMGSSDMIDFSDGPLFTPTPSHLLSTDSIDKTERDVADGEMSGSNGSGETNLNVDCCPKKEEYFLSFDGSQSKVSGSETDISLSFTSHDSCQGHWDSGPPHFVAGLSRSDLDRNHCVVSSSEGQEESSDSFHICFNKSSPQHKNKQYSLRDNVTGRVIKKLVPLKETIIETGDSSEEENLKTSPTLTAGSKELSSFSPQSTTTRGAKVTKPQAEPVAKIKGGNSKKGEHLYLVGIGKPVDILRKAAVHSHTLPRVKKLVSWKQVKGLQSLKKIDNSKCQSLPELSTSTSWQNLSAKKYRNLSEVCDSFHGKRHSASLLEFYQRMKDQSNPVSPETMDNLEKILWPNFLHKNKHVELSDSSSSSQECLHCQCQRQQNFSSEITDSVSKAYTNKRIYDWLKMEYSGSSKESNRPNSLPCQTGPTHECFDQETIISPQTVTLWCGTKNVGSQFPPITKDCSMQTPYDSKFYKDGGLSPGKSHQDQALQTSDFEEEEIMSILSDNYDDFNFLRSNEGIAKDLLSCPEKLYVEQELKQTVHRSKSADDYRLHNGKLTRESEQKTSLERQTRLGKIGRSKSAGRLGSKAESLRRMGLSDHYTHCSLPDIAFLSSSMTLEKDESKESLFDPVKLDLPEPVTVATKTELEQFNIYKQKTMCPPCHAHKPQTSCEIKVKPTANECESSSGISSSSASSGIDPGYCDCRSRSTESPENDLERLIFYPPHTEEPRKRKFCCLTSKRRAQSLPSHLSDCSKGVDASLDKYANEVHPQGDQGPKTKVQGQGRLTPRLVRNKSQDSDVSDHLYALEEEQTPVPSPEQTCHHKNCCPTTEGQTQDHSKCPFFAGGHEFTESDFYDAVENNKIIVVENNCYRGLNMGLDSTSSSGSSVPNSDRKPLKSCLRKRNRGLKSRSLSAADNFINFDDIEEKVKNRHSYACDEVYIVSDEHGQLMMYQADDSAEPVMFYLGKDGECHMTEGSKNHIENFGSEPNFDIQATDSIHGSDSSTEREGGSKRKSVSFASEVSFQSISPAASPKKNANVGTGAAACPDVIADVGGEVKQGEKVAEVTGCQGQVEEIEGQGQDGKKDDQSTNDNKGAVTTTETTTTTATATTSTATPVPSATTGSRSESPRGSLDSQGSSSSDGPPEEFHVAMDTNDNVWPEDVMQEKIDLLVAVSMATDALVAHFARSVDTFDKLRLGNTAETPEVGDIVVTRLCTALTCVIGNGLKHHLSGFQMFGRVNITVWKVVEASVEIVPPTHALNDLLGKVKQTTQLTTHQQRFDAFIFGLLNLRLLDFWLTYIRQKEEQLAKFYESNAILIHASTTLQKHYDDMLTSTQPLAILPFHLQFDFIKEKSLAKSLADSNSKMKSQEMIGSKEGLTGQTANQNSASTSGQGEATNEVVTPMEVTSVLELTATKALNWLTSATLPPKKRAESPDLPESKTKSVSSPVTNAVAVPDPAISANQSSACDSVCEDKDKEVVQLTRANVEKLTDVQRLIYTDARVSNVDCDNILSPADSMRSSQSGLQSLTQSMTNSASSLYNRLMQFGTSLSTRQTAYKKGVTEYSFEEEAAKKQETAVAATADSPKHRPEETTTPTATTPTPAVTEEPKPDIEEIKLKDTTKTSTEEEDKNSKRVSFDIVNLFDKLLLPGGKQEKKEAKPVSKIPRPTSRWSWSFGTSTKPAPSSPQKITKSPAKSDSEISKRGHYPKKTAQVATERTKGGKPATGRTEKARVVPPPKPPRQAGSPTGDKKGRFGSETGVGRRKLIHDVNKNTATL